MKNMNIMMMAMLFSICQVVTANNKFVCINDNTGKYMFVLDRHRVKDAVGGPSVWKSIAMIANNDALAIQLQNKDHEYAIVVQAEPTLPVTFTTQDHYMHEYQGSDLVNPIYDNCGIVASVGGDGKLVVKLFTKSELLNNPSLNTFWNQAKYTAPVVAATPVATPVAVAAPVAAPVAAAPVAASSADGLSGRLADLRLDREEEKNNN